MLDKDGKKVIKDTPHPLVGRQVRMREGETGWYKPAEGEDCEPQAYISQVKKIAGIEYAWIKVVDKKSGISLATPVVPVKGLDSMLTAGATTATKTPADPAVSST